MNVRPRCYEWLPLSTQQLRLRNLQTIHAINIEHPILLMAIQQQNATATGQMDNPHGNNITLYYSLHHQLDTEAFYSSDHLPYHLNLNYKWPEIQSMDLLKSNAKCVCVKVWARFHQLDEENHHQVEQESENTNNLLQSEDNLEELKEVEYRDIPNANDSSLKQQSITNHDNKLMGDYEPESTKDQLLFSWGVYFSGLMPVCLQTEMKYKLNTLIFKFNDTYFTSPSSCTSENLREQLSYNCKAISNNDRHIKYSIPIPNDRLSINSPPVSRSSSPLTVDWQTGLQRICMKRYLQLDCERSQIRQSYNLEKLLKVQERQRDRLRLQRICTEITDEIRNLSVYCVTKEQVEANTRTSRLSNGTITSYPCSQPQQQKQQQRSHYHYNFNATKQYHSMGRTLSLLLAENHTLDTKQLFQAQQLQRELESIRCRKRLLLSAHRTMTNKIDEQRKLLDIATITRRELEEKLNGYREQLETDRLEYLEKCSLLLELRQRKWILTQQIKHRIATLCIGLGRIYPVACNELGYHTICGVPFLSLEIYAQDTAHMQSFQYAEKISPMSLSAAHGYLAHLVQMMAVIMNTPLRNTIIYDASRSSILDTIRNIPTTSREFPLYGRSAIPTKAVKYAICLLNQNIAQLCYDVTNKRCFHRSTVENLKKIFKTMSKWSTTIESNLLTAASNTKHRYEEEAAQLNCDDDEEEETKTNSVLQDTRDSKDMNSCHGWNCSDTVDHGHSDPLPSSSHLNLPSTHSLHDVQGEETPPPPPLLPPQSSNLSSAEYSDHLIYSTKDISRTSDEMTDNESPTIRTQRICRSEGSYTDSEEECHSTRVQCFRQSDSVLMNPSTNDHR